MDAGNSDLRSQVDGLLQLQENEVKTIMVANKTILVQIKLSVESLASYLIA